MASQDAWAGPLAKELVDVFRCQSLTFVRTTSGVYDPATGTIPQVETLVPAAGAVEESGRVEDEGVSEERKLIAWLDHTMVPWPLMPSDELDYMGKRWKITQIDPTYSGDTIYASRVTARCM